MAAYATLQQVYQLGLPAAAFAAIPRAIESADAATGVLTLTGNGLFTGSRLRFVVEGSATPSQPSAALPAGLSTFRMYEALPVDASSDLFQVQQVGGMPINAFGDAGFGVFSIVVDPAQQIQAIIANESANIDNCLTGQAPPIKPDPLTGEYPQILVGVVARRAAIRAALALGLANPIYQATFDRLIAGQAFDDARIEEWLNGRMLRPEVLDQTAYPDDAPRARSGPWRGGCYTRWMTGRI